MPNTHERDAPSSRVSNNAPTERRAPGPAGRDPDLLFPADNSRVAAQLGRHHRHVSIVLATAISSSAVKVSLVMICLSSRMLAKMIMISALVCSSQPMIERLALLPLQDAPGEVHADELAGDRRDQQQRRRDEHRRAAHRPVGAQPGGEEEHRHDRQQHVCRRTDPSAPGRTIASITAPARNAPTMKCRPPSRRANPQTASQIRPDVPAVALRNPPPSRRTTHRTPARSRPGIRACRPDRAPNPAGSARARPRSRCRPGWRNAGCAGRSAARRISSFSISRIRIGSAVTAQAMPMPSTNCQVCAAWPDPATALAEHRRSAAAQPNSERHAAARGPR